MPHPYLSKLCPSHLSALESFPHSEYIDTETGWIKLNANEAAYPPSPGVIRALQKTLERGGDSLRRYPKPLGSGLKTALAEEHKLDVNQVVLGHGSQDILDSILLAFTKKGDSFAHLAPDYPLYAFLAKKHALKPIAIPFTEDLASIALKAIRAPLLCLSSPHWPTGFHFSKQALVSILEGFEGIVIVDEAYIHFSNQEDSIDLLSHYPNLIILRTFSKAYALANMRIAYALGSKDLIGILQKMLSVYTISSLDEAAGMAALRDKAYYSAKIDQLKSLRESTFSFLKNLTWHTYPSNANFLLTQPKDSQDNSSPTIALECYEYLKTYKILLRYFQEDPLTDSYLRITIGSASQMTILLHTLKAYKGLC